MSKNKWRLERHNALKADRHSAALIRLEQLTADLNDTTSTPLPSGWPWTDGNGYQAAFVHALRWHYPELLADLETFARKAGFDTVKELKHCLALADEMQQKYGDGYPEVMAS
jgi:hypothetical protein